MGNKSPNRRSTRTATRRLTVCALLSALAAVALALGGLIEVVDITCSVLAAVVLLPVLLSYGPRYALLSYAVTSVLGVILMPHSLAAWMFVGLTGYYPTVKRYVDRLPLVLRWVVKLLLVALVLAACLLLFYLIMLGGTGSLTEAFLGAFGDGEGSILLAWVFVALAVATFVLFDILLDRLAFVYRVRWAKRVEKWMK